MPPLCFLKTVKLCEKEWFKAVVILLFLAILVTISMAGSTSFFSKKQDAKGTKNIESNNSQTTADELDKGDKYERYDDEDKNEWNDMSERSLESPEVDVQQVNDLALMVIKQKLSQTPIKPCSPGLARVQEEARTRAFRRKSFFYLTRLYRSLTWWTKFADDLEDAAAANWSIRAYSPELKYNGSVVFNRTLGGSCQVTHRELIVPFGCRDISYNKEFIAVDVNGHPMNRTTATLSLHKGAAFDLSKEADSSVLNISVKEMKCITTANLVYSMLFEFCSINKTMRNRLKQVESHFKQTWPYVDEAHYEAVRAQTQQMVSGQERGDNSSCIGCRNETGVEKEQSTGVKNVTDASRVNDIQSFQDESKRIILNHVPEMAHFIKKGRVVSFESALAARLKSSPLQQSTAAETASEKPSLLLSLHKKTSQSPLLSTTQPKPDTGRVKRDASCPSCQQSSRSPARTCSRNQMKVDLFEDLNLPILMPQRPVDVGMCSGTCIHACHMGQVSADITAHAVLLNSIAGTKDAFARWGTGVRMSACVPHRMKTMSVLRVDLNAKNSFQTEIVNWPNMIVDSCRCA